MFSGLLNHGSPDGEGLSLTSIDTVFAFEMSTLSIYAFKLFPWAIAMSDSF